MKIINLTQHAATKTQNDQGVFDFLTDEQKSELLNFEVIPTKADIADRAHVLANIAKDCGANAAMIGGAPYLMGELSQVLKSYDIKPLYAFSTRKVVEVLQEDGSVKKSSIFEHLGFFEA